MRRRTDRFGIAICTLALALAACSAQAPVAAHGPLWKHREKIADALVIRAGLLAGSFRKPAVGCHRYWSDGNPASAALGTAYCDNKARALADRLSALLGTPVESSAVKDASLWEYVAQRAKF